MKRLGLAAVLLSLLLVAGGCKKQQDENDAIRAGILQHLTSVGTLNMSGMDMDIRSVSINGNQALAEVEFRPKNSSPQSGGMRIGYNLEKRDGAWVVQKTQTLGGMMQHPDPNQSSGQNPGQKTGVHPGALPNFKDILNPPAAPSQGQGGLPPGHPPVNSPPQTSAAPPAGQTTSKNPR